jgi:predicted dehydrogenase
MTTRSRRQFLEESMLAAAAAVSVGSQHWAAAAENTQSKSPSEKLGVAVVGVRGRGGEHLSAFSSRKDTEVLWIVDADSNVGGARVEEVAKRQGRKPKYTQDMREAFADPSVDVVSTATPNHWHSLVSIWAMQHGKDVYVEKPVSHNVSEGRRVVEAARKYNKICQTGTQCRSMQGTRHAMD